MIITTIIARHRAWSSGRNATYKFKSCCHRYLYLLLKCFTRNLVFTAKEFYFLYVTSWYHDDNSDLEFHSCLLLFLDLHLMWDILFVQGKVVDRYHPNVKIKIQDMISSSMPSLVSRPSFNARHQTRFSPHLLHLRRPFFYKVKTELLPLTLPVQHFAIEENLPVFCEEKKLL